MPQSTPPAASSPRSEVDDDRKLLLRIVEEAYRQSTWNETNLRSSLKDVSAAQASWRPVHARHTIAEIVLHSAYWKFVTRRRLTGDRSATFAFEGKDWFQIEQPLDDERWAALLALLDDEHRELCGAIKRSDRDLQYDKRTERELVRKIFGIAMHDAYHTGQIHLIEAQYKRALGGRK